MVVMTNTFFSFRPLTGIMVLIREVILWKTRKNKSVSVPLRGLWFLSPVDTSDEEDQGEIGFRPLTGIMVLI